jgi:hypothetical protein
MAERLKRFDGITQPDCRWRYFVRRTRTVGGGGWRPIAQKDLYDDVARIRLNETVPKDVRCQFSIAQNLCVQAWYDYEFNVQAGFLAAVCLERALRFRLAANASLEKLIDRAVLSGLLSPVEAGQCHSLRELRNSVAHGSTVVHNHGSRLLRIAAQIINRLYAAAVP